MSNKKGLSFEARLWLVIFLSIVGLCVFIVACVLCNVINFIAYVPNPTGVAIVVATCVIASAIIVATGILAYTIHKVFGKNNDEKK